jgi:hypothetical protein
MKPSEVRCAQCKRTKHEAGIRSWQVEKAGGVLCRSCSFQYELDNNGEAQPTESTLFSQKWRKFFLSEELPRLDMAWKATWEGECGNVCVVKDPWGEIVFRLYVPVIDLEARRLIQLIELTVQDYVKVWDKPKAFTEPFNTTFDVEVEIANTWEHQRAIQNYEPFVVSVMFSNRKSGVAV